MDTPRTITPGAGRGQYTGRAPDVIQVIADFSASPTSGSAPLTVTCTNASLNATGYLWTFGDGTAGSTLANPTHIYTEEGTFAVSLQATGPGGGSDTEVKAAFVTVGTLLDRSSQTQGCFG